MNISSLLASQLREVQLNGTWVATNLMTQLEDVTLVEAQTKIGSLNTISDLVFHINYYISGLIDAIGSGSLTIKDKYSFEYQPFQSEEAWQAFLYKCRADADKFAQIIEETNNDKLATFFFQENYGTYFRNFQCMIEHSYYHLGQIVILKKLIRESHSLT
jgi:uncharacterized damage-inducible protein DinB